METQPYRVENGVLMTVVLGPTDDGADDRGAVAILRGVGRVDGGVRVRGRLGEGDATFDAAGPDTAGAAGLRPTERGVAGSVDRADRQVVASPHNPDGHVRALGAIGFRTPDKAS